ncbi:FecCD family ABC transporter permease [Umezawaea sp. NPDC059074]|uniref:FecCD family ABC transporter permease n=1 Tax=Umezawaea sp. NPDC059074 TaxID=3346716 RepID=UPI00368D6CCA
MSAPVKVRGRVVRTGGVSFRVHDRTVVVCLALLAAVVGIGLVTMTTGDFELTVSDVVKSLIGQGDGASDFIVLTLRLPRLLTGILVGAALAVSGGILQSLSGNPLASPDIIGFTQGAATGAILVIVLVDGSMVQIGAGALVGGVATAVVVYLLAFKQGVQGFRLILIGIGISFIMLSLNKYLITRASLTDAIAAQAWQVGGLNGRGWEHVQVVGLAVVVLLPLALHFGRRLALMEMGDATAKGLGVNAERTRLALIAISVGLAAVATAAAGPVSFLALAAPQLSRRLTGSAGAGLVAAALMGALLLTAGDLAVQRLFSPAQLPVGFATGALGGLYLLWLLAHEWRRGIAR